MNSAIFRFFFFFSS
ncbi:pheST operon leader peptide PheM [Pragia fontium]